MGPTTSCPIENPSRKIPTINWACEEFELRAIAKAGSAGKDISIESGVTPVNKVRITITVNDVPLTAKGAFWEKFFSLIVQFYRQHQRLVHLLVLQLRPIFLPGILNFSLHPERRQSIEFQS